MSKSEKKVIHCKRCVLTNQKPHSINESTNKVGDGKKYLVIHPDGVCVACKYSDKKNVNINWTQREKELKKILNKYRKSNGEYDCIVPGSGGKDSCTVAHLLKYKYKMNPLTVTFAPTIYTDIGKKNMDSWINVGGFDNYLFKRNGKVSSILTREAFKNLLHPMQPFKFGIKTFAAKMALKLNIDLIFYGEPFLEYGSSDNKNELTPDFPLEMLAYDKNPYISGLSVNTLKKKYKFNDNDLSPYMPIKSRDIKNSKIKILFLGWFLKWNPQEIYYYASKNCGYVPDTQRIDGTYGRYAGVDDKIEWLHFFCHYIKFGIGRCRLDASQEIRSGHITREEAIALCKKYEGEVPTRYLKDCFKFMKITDLEGWKIIDKFRPKHLWKKNKQNKWIRKQELKELV